jgi:hypothetical protein
LRYLRADNRESYEVLIKELKLKESKKFEEKEMEIKKILEAEEKEDLPVGESPEDTNEEE